MKIFLDDIRKPETCNKYMHLTIGNLSNLYLGNDWLIVRNYDEFVNSVTRNYKLITHISFDHDLAPDHYIHSDRQDFINYDEYQEKTGYDCAKWLKEFYQEKGKKLPILFCHSMNPVGVQNIINLFEK